MSDDDSQGEGGEGAKIARSGVVTTASDGHDVVVFFSGKSDGNDGSGPKPGAKRCHEGIESEDGNPNRAVGAAFIQWMANGDADTADGAKPSSGETKLENLKEKTCDTLYPVPRSVPRTPSANPGFSCAIPQDDHFRGLNEI